MFIAMLFTIAKTWKQPKCSSADEWLKKMYTHTHTCTHTHTQTHTREYYSGMRKKEILSFVTTRVDPKGVMLSEINQTKEDG